MQQLPEDISREDLSQWLGRGFFYADVPEVGRVLCSLVEVHDPNTVYVIPLGTRNPVRVRREDIWSHWPLCGCINTQHGALYVQRKVERQWRRVYSGRFVTITIPWEWEAIRLRPPLGGYNGDNAEVVKALFSPEYPGSVGEAMERIDGPKTPGTVALNRLIIFDKEGGLHYNGDLIGHLNSNQQFVPTCGERLARRVEKYIEGGLAL